MKKFNQNFLVFIAAMLIVLMGLFGQDLLVASSDAVKTLGTQLITKNPDAVKNFTQSIDTISSRNLSNRYQLISINSLKENLLGTRIVYKDDATVVKSDSESLMGLTQNRFSVKGIRNRAEETKKLQEFVESCGAKFLYCVLPTKEIWLESPSNMPGYDRENYENMVAELSDLQVPYVDLVSELESYGFADEEVFFVTDHHWTPRAGFLATKTICQKLNEKYGFICDETALDLGNYNIQKYENWFLGSYGKQVGLYFTWQGADDFELITPNFPTDMTEELPATGKVRNGTFEETMLLEHGLTKNYYLVNTYATYSGGDYRLQILRNHQQPDGDTILVLRRSFACVVTPFLALQAKEVHVVDDRPGDYPAGDPVDVEDYIREIQPDYVIVLK